MSYRSFVGSSKIQVSSRVLVRVDRAISWDSLSPPGTLKSAEYLDYISGFVVREGLTSLHWAISWFIEIAGSEKGRKTPSENSLYVSSGVIINNRPLALLRNTGYDASGQ